MTTLAVRLPSKEERQNAIDLERLAEHLSACHHAHELETKQDFVVALEEFERRNGVTVQETRITWCSVTGSAYSHYSLADHLAKLSAMGDEWLNFFNEVDFVRALEDYQSEGDGTIWFQSKEGWAKKMQAMAVTDIEREAKRYKWTTAKLERALSDNDKRYKKIIVKIHEERGEN